MLSHKCGYRGYAIVVLAHETKLMCQVCHRLTANGLEMILYDVETGHVRGLSTRISYETGKGKCQCPICSGSAKRSVQYSLGGPRLLVTDFPGIYLESSARVPLKLSRPFAVCGVRFAVCGQTSVLKEVRSWVSWEGIRNDTRSGCQKIR